VRRGNTDLQPGLRVLPGSAFSKPAGRAAAQSGLPAHPMALSRVAAARGLRRWEGRIREGLRAMHARSEFPAQASPDDLALATLAALQGGLLMTPLQREAKPLEVALDAMLDRL